MEVHYIKTPRWKYRTEHPYEVPTPIAADWLPVDGTIGNDYVSLGRLGLLSIARHYAWDGPSGPTIDTRNWMRASLVHDALYQLLREGLLPQHYRYAADRLMYDHLRKDGMSAIRARVAYRAVRLFGAKAAQPRQPPQVLTAP